jgi:hypothetical protein
LTINPYGNDDSNKKIKYVTPQSAFIAEYQQKLNMQNQEKSMEISRHNKAMERIAETTADLEYKKTAIEIGFITKSSEIENEKKMLELKIKKFETYEALKAKGMKNNRIKIMFPNLMEFMEDESDED